MTDPDGAMTDTSQTGAEATVAPHLEHGHASAKPSAVRLVLAHPLYRASTLALFLSGLGISAAAPLIASFLVTELGASLTVAGLYYLTNLTAPIAGYLVGARSDRTGKRLGLFRICAVAAVRGAAR